MKPFILIIIGPAGSGKSTVASRLAGEIDQCVNIDVDLIKHMIVNGFIYGSKPEGIVQWRLLGLNVGILAKNFHDGGYSVIINGYINEPAWQNIQKHVRPDHKVLLLPHADIATGRDAGRHKDHWVGAKTIKEHYAYFTEARFCRDFVRIDSTKHTIDETIAAVKKIL